MVEWNWYVAKINYLNVFNSSNILVSCLQISVVETYTKCHSGLSY